MMHNKWRSACSTGIENPKERITAHDALVHPWFSKYEISRESRKEQEENLIQSLQNLKNFDTILHREHVAEGRPQLYRLARN